MKCLLGSSLSHYLFRMFNHFISTNGYITNFQLTCSAVALGPVIRKVIEGSILDG